MSNYTCSQCGAAINTTQNRCHECGSEIEWEQAVGRVRYTSRLPELGPPRGPRFRTLILGSFVAVTVLAVLLLAGLWGIERGLQERRAVIGEIAFEQYRQGVQDILNGDLDSARQKFGQVVVVEVQVTSTPTPAPTPPADPAETALPESSPTPEAPTPTPSLNQIAQDEALAQVQALMDGEQWQEAIEKLHIVIELDPGYQTGLVGQMLFNAYYNQALAYEADKDIENATIALNEALRLRPENTNGLKFKQAISLYQEGLAAKGEDWDTAINIFTELFALNPDFLDTPEQLFYAYADYGDSLRRSNPCFAIERYQLALQLQRDPQVRAKLDDARLRCGEQPTITVADAGDTPAPQSGGPTPTVATGRIAYTFFDNDLTYHRTRFWDINGSAPGTSIADEALQPDVGPNDAIAVRSTHHDSYGIAIIKDSGQPATRLTKEAGDRSPRWSPDGKHIAFTSTSRNDDNNTHVYLLDLGSGAVEDLGLGQDPDWAPDGLQIVYQNCGDSDDQCGLWIIDLELGDHRQITTNAGDAMPAWSSDGKLIAFMSAGRSPSWDIFVADAGTGDIRSFTLDDADDGLPTWSPDGQFLAFLSNREGDWAVYAWSLDDLSVNRLFPVDGPLPSWQEAGLDWVE